MPDIQEMLLHYLAGLLGYKLETTDSRIRRSTSSTGSFQIQQEISKNEGKGEDTETIALALQTLGSFKFATNTNVRSFEGPIRDTLQNCVINYLSYDNPMIRKEAVLTSAALLGASSASRGTLMSEVLDKLLILGISDRDDSIRRAGKKIIRKKENSDKKSKRTTIVVLTCSSDGISRYQIRSVACSA